MYYKSRKLITIILVIFLGMVSVFYANIKFSTPAAKNKFHNNDIKYKVILLDPGHGGVDGGAVSKSGIMEKDINLKISLKLRDKLTKEGYKVLMTREEDKGLYEDEGRIRKKKIEDLNNRCKIKEQSNCDMFISIHLNAFPESKYYGAQVWYSRNRDSQKLARIIQENFKNDLDSSNNRHQKSALDSYKVLRVNDDMPSVLVECGFLSNTIEEAKLNSDEYQSKIADCITKSIKLYYNQ
ncbi:germination-specific N-acetylmuramoyl-L-alanine amidase precursor [Clostridium magnum DSM 2767]|uniref:Germination-specific N-acetylmuramoyl-L-alanine amidase n=2 Tax=Clostridium magnum TaxID=33954 RepID=A0A162TYC1_9CLOT|nr:germination-specific N-acetylmuramoyl-L-alanine amidase precursor [Clostridium magnum DSM 2767]SHI19531.1 N-acetylmuramoyl-L-alanine amidase [Clostridium magnum DSM 2767]